MSRTRKKDSQVCRKKAPGVFTCPPSKPIGPSTVLAIPYYPASHPSLLIDSTGLIDREIHHYAVIINFKSKITFRFDHKTCPF